MAGDKYQYVLPKRMKAVMDRRRGVTVSWLAGQTGVSSKTIYGWLAGNPPRHLEDLFSVVRALNSNIEELAFVKVGDERGTTQRVLFGQWLKLCRDRMRMSEREVSDRLGLLPGVLKSYEDGEDISVGVLLSLVRLYHIDKTVLSARMADLI